MDDFKNIIVKKGTTKVIVVKNPTSYEFIGNGVQGAVFKLSNCRCVKIYPIEKHAAMEQEVLKAAKQSEFFPKLYESGKNFTVMEYIPGWTLEEYLIQKNKIPKNIVKQLLTMLKERKKLGIPRCDANLRHIILTKNEKLKVIDHVNSFRKKRPVPTSMIEGLYNLGLLENFLNIVKALDRKMYKKWKYSYRLAKYINRYKKKRTLKSQKIERQKKNSDKTILNNFEIGECIGRGLQSRVYKAYDLVNKRNVAIKKRKNIVGAKQEVEIMSKFGQHPSLPKLYDYFTYKNYAYIVLEYVHGDSLGTGRKVVKKSEIDAIEITINVLYVLGHLHKHNILHGDTLPKNVMVLHGQKSKIKLIDYGFSFQKDREGVYKGKVRYKRVTEKPFEFREQPLLLDDTTDIYLAGYLCVSLLNGRPPKWSEKEGKHTFKVKNKYLEDVLQKAMSKEKRLRYSNTEEFIHALKGLI